ncbi:MAG TPA: oxidoreductase [Gemmatimonadales bacterium]|jgi:NAD(P)-dependent dehydrogenase (short-subunit alcohol dehydrogenase family)|nr:oxidoreductase [Gemmatimonadales bacterium]
MSGTQKEQTRPVAIVTGASGGIGEATARALHEAGYRVFGTSRRAPATTSPGIEYLVCDVTSDESVKAAVGEVLSKAGRVDLLVNNAGVGLVAGAEESSLEQAKSLFDVNLFGLIRMTKAVLPTMRKQRAGRIVNLSSVMGLIPAPFMALYAASKHAVEGYSESLDHEIRGSGVRVVLVEPAYTRTSFEGNVYHADQQLDVYRSARANAEGVLRDGMKTADTPELVARAVVNASTEANPRRRYTAGRAARQISLLRRFVPASAFDKSLRKQMRLPA